MKEVNIITIHFGVNHGSALQAYALSDYINRLEGYHARIIDYVPQRYRLWNGLLSRKKGRYPMAMLYLYYPVFAAKNLPVRKRFERFLKQNLEMTRRYSAMEELVSDPPGGDIFLAGSDQIFNDDYNGAGEEAYYLSFAPQGARKIAYSASFGKSYPLPEEEVRIFRNRLKNFDSLSLREDDAVDIVGQCGYEGIHVCDPTLLLSREEWSRFAAKRKAQDRYLLVYVMDHSYQGLLDNAEILAGKAGLKIYVISFSKIRDKRIDKCFYKCSPKDFVGMVRDAQMVVTNSFHGTVFSTLFRKPMLILGKRNYNSRMLSILKKAGLRDRFVDFGDVIGEEKAPYFLEALDEAKVDAALNQWIADSKAYLQAELSKG